MKLQALYWYSNGTMRCDCCNEKDIRLLTFDHIDGGGKQHVIKDNIKNLYEYLYYNSLRNARIFFIHFSLFSCISLTDNESIFLIPLLGYVHILKQRGNADGTKKTTHMISTLLNFPFEKRRLV